MPSLTLDSPAKVNLGLWVGSRRIDGYHDIVTLTVPLRLCDRVRIATARSGVRVSTSGHAVADDETNLAYRAATAFFDQVRVRAGCRIRIRKRIPVGAGLGGGSSNAATVLRGLNRLHGFPLSAQHLKRVGLSLGSDIPALLYRQPCAVRGRGERLRPVRLPELRILLHFPGYPVDTAWAYAELDRWRRSGRALTSPGLLPKILAARLRRGELAGAARLIRNSFEPVVFTRHPDLARVRRLLLEAGCYAAALSGSGSTVYGLVNEQGSQDPMAAMARQGYRCVPTHSI